MFTIITPLIHNIAIRDVTPSKTVVGQGYSLQINVTIENWDYTESFNVTAYYNDTIIILPSGKNRTTTTITSGNSTTVTFTWNSTGVAKGNYTMSAYATPVPGETETTDNTLAGGVVTVVMVGDVNNDGLVDITDVAMVAYAYDSKPGHPRWHPNLDVNSDNIIDITDVAIVAYEYGKADP